jgi:hypothetical protein
LPFQNDTIDGRSRFLKAKKEEKKRTPMIPSKKLSFLLMILLAVTMTACSGVKSASGGGGGGGTPSATTFTIGGTVSGLTGTGLVLLDNGGDALTVAPGTGPLTFTFKTALNSGDAYAVTVGTQPSSPSQTCTVSNGTGTATANVTSVAVTCTTATVTVGGTVTGLTGTGLMLLDNGGDALTVTGTGTVQFTFKTALNLGGLYNVTVQTQPTNPTQTCSITNGSGAATANVTNIGISCSSKYSIGGTVNGLSGSGLVLQNNGLDNLPISASGQFTFPTLVPGTYSVTVLTQPSNPTQTCVVSNGTGMATANVSNVTVTCSSGFPIGGTVSGLSGAGLVLEDNGGDDLTVVGTGSVKFTFASLVTGAYAVTVKTQPSNPAQNCTVVSNGTGTATAPVTNVQISCGAVYAIGGTISGLLGSGLTLEDTLGTVLDQLLITGKGSVPFTFAIPAPINSTYTVSVVTQPTNPAQNCFVNNGTGKVSGNVNTVQVVCQQPSWTISGTQVGLVTLAYNGTPLSGGFTELINNGGDNIFVAGNNVGFHFPTGVTNNGNYNVNVFLQPASQPQPCTAFYYTGVASANVDSVIIDCQHNDFAWMFGPDSVGTYGPYGLANLPPPPPPAADTNTPGGRDFSATWSDTSGLKWMFGGWGLPVSGANPPFIPFFMGDLWVFIPGAGSGGETGIWVPADLPTTTTVTTLGVTTVTADTHPLQSPGSYSVGANSSVTYTDKLSGDTITNFTPAVPGARWGSVTWTDASGNFYLFGGQGHAAPGHGGLLNDLWKFTPDHYDVSVPSLNYSGSYTYVGSWANLGGLATANAPGVYSGSALPGGRWGAAYCTDSAGTLWMFGGQGYDSNGAIGLLNDLWKYSGGQWTWVGPPNSSLGQNNGVYGALGTATTGAYPGGRQTAVLWADNNGNLWLFGGLGLDSVGTQNPGNAGTLPDGSSPEGALLNDLWQYNIATQQWTWMSGGGATGIAQQIGVYGSQQVPAAGFYPGSRWGSSGWSDSNGNLWFFGGWGYASSLAQSTGFLDDIWEYHTTGPNVGLWTWWKGSSNVNESGNYPTYLPIQYGVPFVNNQPGARRGVALWQQDAQQNVWMFGGQGYDSLGANGYLGETWTYLPFPY